MSAKPRHLLVGAGTVTTLLDKYRTGSSGYEYTSYDKVTEPQRKELSDGVNKLAEPLSELAAAVVK